MNIVTYETKTERGVRVSVTLCTRRKIHDRMIGSRYCCGCSYCYDVDRINKIVLCMKNTTMKGHEPSGTARR